MTNKEKKSKIADILMDFQEEYSNDVINRPMLASLYAGNILSFIDSLQEEPKFKTGDRIKPVDSCLGSPRTIVDICNSWYVTDQGTLDFEFEDNWELVEEPVSDDLEEASKNYALNNTPWDDCKDEIQESFKAGANWQKIKDESTTEDLGEYINKLSKQFPEVSFAKLSRIAVRVAKWQREQMEIV